MARRDPHRAKQLLRRLWWGRPRSNRWCRDQGSLELLCRYIEPVAAWRIYGLGCNFVLYGFTEGSFSNLEGLKIGDGIFLRK